MYRDGLTRAEPDITPVIPEEVETEEAGDEHIHYPSLSVWPITLALAITLAGAGIVTTPLISFVGIVLGIWAIISWIQELRHEYQHQSH